MNKNRVSTEVIFQGKTYEAVFDLPDSVALFSDGVFAGFASWNAGRKRIERGSEQLPAAVMLLLSQRLRTSLLGNAIAQRQVKKERPTAASVHELFRNFGFPEMPADCKRWARVKLRQLYSAFVVGEHILVFRNWVMIGKAEWDESVEKVGSYVGEKVPEPVWLRLSRQLTDYPVS